LEKEGTISFAKAYKYFVEMHKICEKFKNKVGVEETGDVLAEFQFTNMDDDQLELLLGTFMEYSKLVFKKLYFFRNRIGDRGASAVANFIKNTTYHIQEVHLSHNCISWNGAKGTRLYWRFYRNTVDYTTKLFWRLCCNIVAVDDHVISYCIANDERNIGRDLRERSLSFQR
jgi:hypothetical protein